MREVGDLYDDLRAFSMSRDIQEILILDVVCIIISIQLDIMTETFFLLEDGVVTKNISNVIRILQLTRTRSHDNRSFVMKVENPASRQ